MPFKYVKNKSKFIIILHEVHIWINKHTALLNWFTFLHSFISRKRYSME